MLASVGTVLFIVGCVSPSGMDLLDPRADFGRPTKPTARAEAYSRYLSGVFLEHQGKFDEALEQLEQVPELDPEAVTPTLRLIRAHLRQRNFEEALAMAEREGHRISFGAFLRYGLTVTIGSMIVATAYVWLRYLA